MTGGKKEFIARLNAALLDRVKNGQWSFDYRPAYFSVGDTATLACDAIEIRVKVSSGYYVSDLNFRISDEWYFTDDGKLKRAARKLVCAHIDRYWNAKSEEDYQKLVAMALKAEGAQ